jgi:hypothetical protein
MAYSQFVPQLKKGWPPLDQPIAVQLLTNRTSNNTKSNKANASKSFITNIFITFIPLGGLFTYLYSCNKAFKKAFLFFLQIK